MICLKIGITCLKNTVPLNYIKWVKKAGFEPVIIDRISHLNRLKKCDAILFSGGGDIKHWFYSSKKIGNGNNATRDVFEYFAFLESKHLPILAVCRGAQIINVFMGGTLKDLNNAYMHSGENDVFHPVFIKNHTYLINSQHHQGIDKLSDKLFAIGFYNECIEIAKGENILLCQYHPERINHHIILQTFKGIIKKNKHNLK